MTSFSTLTGSARNSIVAHTHSMSTSDYYRIKPLVQQDFQIALSRQVDVLASTGVQLFIASVMAIGQNEEGNYQCMWLCVFWCYGDDEE